jgi:hypothetical protein
MNERMTGASSLDSPLWVGQVRYDDIHVDTQLGPAEWKITTDEIDRHCLVTGEFHVWYTVGHPTVGRVAPLSLSYLRSRHLFSEAVPLSGLFAGWSHRQLGFLRPEVTFVLQGRVTDKYVRREREWVWYEVACSDAETGEEVFRTSRGHVLDYSTDRSETSPAAPTAGEVASGYRPFVFESNNVGERLADAPVHVPHPRATAFPIGSDLTPVSFQLTQRSATEFLHGLRGHDEAEGLPAPVASGPHAAAQIHKMMVASFGGGYLEKGSFNFRFIRLIMREDFLTAKGVVVGHRLEDGAVRVECDVWVERHTGEKLVVGSASAAISV